MKLSKSLLVFLGAAPCVVFSACGGSSSSPAAGPSCPAANTSCTNAAGSTAIPTSASASVPFYIGDPNTTGAWTYPNEPLVSVTICTPGHTSASQCQTISNILLDTGSFGLRVFGSAIAPNVQLAQQSVSVAGASKPLAECAEFGSGADWGSVQNADVMLGNQTASNIPIQVININFGSIPSGCAALCPDTDPCTAGFNGILGVGPFAQDCGTACANYTDDTINYGSYFGCDGNGCYNAYAGNCGSDSTCMVEVPISQQIVNPVAQFGAGFNNGVSLTLPSVATTGASSVTGGTLQLGISSPTSVTLFPADPDGLFDGDSSDFTTIFQGTTYGGATSDPSSQTDPSLAFIDSGSNALFFPSAITECADASGFYCAGSTQSLSATMQGFSGTPSSSVSFSVADTDALLNTGNSAFNNLCGPEQGMFDWGLPFFYGRTVYVGLSGTAATVNTQSATGPYWAF
jgi:hypothetical protein